MFGIKNKQRGSVTVFFALSLPVLLGVTAFAVDLGNGFYQKHRLQNIADSVALAGCKTLSSKAKVQLLSEDTIENDSKFNNAITLDENDDDYTKAFARSKAMLDSNNTGQDEDAKSKFTKEDTLIKVYTPGENDTSKNTVKYYVVKLQEEVPTYFAGILGKDHFDIFATSIAKIENQPPPVTEEEKEDFIKEINASIYETIPDYYSETIERITGTKNRYNPDYHLEAMRREATAQAWSADYYTMINKKYVYNLNPDKTITAFRDPNEPDDPAEDKELNFAQPFIEISKDKLVYAECKFKDGFDFTQIKAAFLDMPNIYDRNKNYRGMIFNISNNADQKLGNSEDPFFIRIESEPVRVLQGDQYLDTTKYWNGGRTLVSTKIINVDVKTRRPLVIAYDGPDPNRTEDDAPILDEYDPETGTTKKTTTAVNSTAPFRIYLNNDFKGVIYAPRSHVHIYGTGKIDGLILARKITTHGNQSSTRTVTETENDVEIPIWVLDKQYNSDGSEKGYHDNNYLYAALKNGKYKESKISDKFAIAYDDFCNYTILDYED